MDTTGTERRTYRSLIWTPIIAMILVVIAIMLYSVYRSTVIVAPLEDFNQMVVSDGFHSISLPSGQHFDLSYEQNHDRYFDGLVRHTSMNHEKDFPIISFDILVTTGDYADDTKVSTSVSDHHFTWRADSGITPEGTINLLHTVPMNQALEEQLLSIKSGDHVIIKGWEILKIDAYSRTGDYIGYWQDAGCNTTLITEVYINP